MAKSKHLIDWKENEHISNPEKTGCIWRHTDYKLKKYPRCNYRKNAHDYSKANETDIYNIPNLRSTQEHINKHIDKLDYSYSKSGKKKKGTKPLTPGPDWDLEKGENFTKSKVPYWHNTHHCIAVGEINDNFEEDEQKLILTTKWNINAKDDYNCIILPKQYAVATILKLPTHVPPDGTQQHPKYSRKIGNGLQDIKMKLSKNADNNDNHKLSDKNAPGCKNALINVSKQLRKTLIEAGETLPGVNIEQVNFQKINWSETIES